MEEMIDDKEDRYLASFYDPVNDQGQKTLYMARAQKIYKVTFDKGG